MGKILLKLIAMGAMCLLPLAAKGQDAVTLQELEGSTIIYQAVMGQYVEKNGQRYAVQTTFNDKIELGKGGTLQHTSTATSVREGRVKTGKTNVSPFLTIEKPSTTDMGRGQGYAVWVFEGGTLTMLRTYKSGAHKKIFTLTRSADGIACKYDHIWAFEDGRKSIEVTSAVDGQPLVILNYKQVSSRCRLVKKPD